MHKKLETRNVTVMYRPWTNALSNMRMFHSFSFSIIIIYRFYRLWWKQWFKLDILPAWVMTCLVTLRSEWDDLEKVKPLYNM